MKTDKKTERAEDVEAPTKFYREMDLRFDPAAAASLARADGTPDDRIPIALSSETPVERYDWWEGETYNEILDHSADGVDLSYAADGLPFLLNHDTGEQVGLIEDVKVEDRKLRGLVRFSKSQRAQEIRQDIVDGIRKKISVGYKQSDTYDQKEENGVITRRYKGWMPMEGSSVPIPADYSVGVGRSADGAARNRPSNGPRANKEQVVDKNDTAAPGNGAATSDVRVVESNERTRAEAISALAQEHGFSERTADWISSQKSITDVQREIIVGLRERLAKPTQSGKPSVELSDKERKQYSFARAILADAGDSEIKVDAGFEREVSRELEKNLPASYKRRGGLLIPTMTRAGLDSATSTKGSELKFTQPGEFIELLRNRIKVRALGARVLSGLTGPVSFPKQNGAATASWMGENSGSDVSESNLLLTTVTLAIKTLMASTSFSRQLLVSAISGSVDAEQMVRDDLAIIHALAIDLAAINGSGSSNQPRGVLNTSGIGSVAGGTNGLAAAYSHIVALETAVATANADADNCAYLTNATQRGKLKQIAQLANTANVPVWNNGEMNGYKAEVSNQVPANLDKGTSTGVCSAIIFGDWSQVLIGEWGALEVLSDPYRLKKQGMIEVTSFQMVDVALRYAEAFAAMKDAL